MYEMEARQYDPAIARWVVDDPYNNRPAENASQEGPGDGQSTYIPPPKELPGFPGATRLGHQNGKRPAWRLPDGSLAEWDSQHGELEVYDKTGKKHKGAYNPETGEKKPESGVPGRRATRSKYIETLPTMTVESTRVYRYQREPGYPFNNATFNPPSAVQTVTWGGIILIAAIVILSPVGM